MRTGDFNRDGIPDLALQVSASPTSFINILFGNGDETFQLQNAVAVSDFIEDFVVGDFNDDGNLDVVW
ncbi:MAG: VCBS repeat-containing protein, partial [Acidobacteriales bacterium]|nr:VCBS repeat-containing protein [Terriglobales bacterium]